jgi:hypothetical protein
MSKDKDLGLQRSPRSEYSDQGAPDQPAKIRGRGKLFWVCGRDKGREYTPQSEVTHEGGRWICHMRTGFSNNIGVLGFTTKPGALAGQFIGNLQVTGTKAAVVPFPDGTHRAL